MPIVLKPLDPAPTHIPKFTLTKVDLNEDLIVLNYVPQSQEDYGTQNQKLKKSCNSRSTLFFSCVPSKEENARDLSSGICFS